MLGEYRMFNKKNPLQGDRWRIVEVTICAYPYFKQ